MTRRADRGQGTVELALVLPVVVVLMLSVFQVGLVARDYLLVWHAAREAARSAAVEPTAAEARSAARSASSLLQATRLGVELSGGQDTGDLLVVTVTYRAPTDVPLVGAAIGDVSLSADVTVRVE